MKIYYLENPDKYPEKSFFVMSSFRYTLQTIPPSKLLHYISQAHLRSFLGIERYQALIERFNSSTSEKFSVREFKAWLANNSAFISELRASSLGQSAFGKYRESVERIQNPAFKTRAAQVRSSMTPARRGFQGCIMTKLKPSDIKRCVHDHNHEEYAHIRVVPTAALKKRVVELGHSNLGPIPVGAERKYLPRGLLSYIRRHPEDYQEYLTARSEELKQLRALKKTSQATNEEILDFVIPPESPRRMQTRSRTQHVRAAEPAGRRQRFVDTLSSSRK